MAIQTLIEAPDLAARLQDPGWVVVDCRFDLMDAEAGRRAHRRSHVPGARYAHLGHDLAREPGPRDGRHPLPGPDAFAARLGEWGISSGSRVVAYDDGSGAFAARLWWMLRWIGHDRASVLNGGWNVWQAHGLPVETKAPAWDRARYEPKTVRDDWLAAADDVGALQEAGNLLVDVRAAERYRGERESIDPVAGHVPGARNWPFSNAVGRDGRFRDDLRTSLSELLGGRDPARLIAMCGSGVTACHLLLAMHVAGLGDGRLFAGSWSEWIRDPERPIATGSAPGHAAG